jgi:hypothetical protein
VYKQTNTRNLTNKQQALLLIMFIIYSSIFSLTSCTSNQTLNKFKNEMNRIQYLNTSPSEILRFTEIEKSIDNKLKIEVAERDPLKYLALKQEIIDLYANNGKKSSNSIFRFKQNKNSAKMNRQDANNSMNLQNNQNSQQNIQNQNISPKNINSNQNLNTQDSQQNIEENSDNIKPYEVGRIGLPSEKKYNNQEEIVAIKNLLADSNYIKYGKNREILMKMEAKSMLEPEKFWCSAGGHDVKDEVKFFIEFPKSYSLTAMWVHWAFAPGEFKIMYSNDKKQWYDLLGGYRLSIKNGDVNWWRSVLLNPKTRWKYKSFDERINFDEPFFAKYVELTMRIPVNQYFGIFNLEFYTKSQSLVMLKSKSVGDDLCLSVTNGQFTNGSPVVGLNCLQAVSYGDNRDLWVINSNGYITTHKKRKCLQSPDNDSVNIVDCGLAADFKDDREKWILDFDGKIRSVKEQFTCLTLADISSGDELLASELKVTSTSTQSSGRHSPENGLDNSSQTYWASNPSNQDVIYEIYFHKYPTIIKRIIIDWKFPAKKFKVIGMMTDGFWKDFISLKNNRETIVDVNMNNYDLLGIKIVMMESTTKFEDKNIYGISIIKIHTGTRGLRREPCTRILGDTNLWEIVYVNHFNDVSGQEYNKSWAELHVTRNKFKLLKNFFMRIPDTLIIMKQNAVEIKKKLIKIESDYSSLDSRLYSFENILSATGSNFYTLATNKFTPAHDCAHIIKTFPSKRSGYYWVQNECMPKPLRVYCDFDSYDKKGGIDYYIFNDNQPLNSRIEKIKNYKDVRLMCNKIGMEPIEVKNYKMLKQIIRLLKDNNYNLNDHSGHFVPIGYDYSCDHSTCSKLYRSFSSRKSGNINDLFNIYKKEMTSNVLLNFFNGYDPTSEDEVKNSAGLGSNYRIEYGKLSKKNILAVVCSTNKDGIKQEKGYINLECDSNIRSDAFRNLEIFSHLRFVCPRNCSISKSAVYGSNIYTDNSSVCKAAVHAGVINDSEGGIVELGVQPGSTNYKGSNKHNVETLDYLEKWDRSFTVSKYQPYCPIDKLRDYANSMGVGSMFTHKQSSFLSFTEKTEMVKDLELDIQKRLKNLIEEGQAEQRKISFSDANQANYEINENKIKKLLLASELLKFIQTSNRNAVSGKNLEKNKYFVNHNNFNSHHNSPIPGLRINNNNRLLGNNNFYNNDYVENPYPVDSNSSPTISQITTDDALVSISAINNKDQEIVNQSLKIISTFKTLIGKSSNEILTLLSDKDIGLSSLSSKFSLFESKIENVNKLIFEIDKKSQIQFKKAEHKLRRLKNEAVKDSLRDNFMEDYSTSNILENYEIFNSGKGLGETPKWDYYMYNLDGHLKTIHQVGEFIDNRTGSHLILKNRDFFDFELKFSVLIQGTNNFGVCFRYIDSFNYYIFEISNQGKGFKRLRKFVRGESETIDIKYDGGYVVDTWYNVKIRGTHSEFKIYMTTDNSVNMNDHYELVFHFSDNQIVHGSFAFASNGLKSLMIDNISAVHIYCTDFDSKAREDTSLNANVITPHCPRFREYLKNSYIFNWKKIDPLETINGPSNWVKLKNVDRREKVLAQTSTIQGLSPNQEGTMYMLNMAEKVCSKGKISIKVKAMDKGIVGIVFRYNNGFDYSSSSMVKKINKIFKNSEKSNNNSNINKSNYSYYILEVSGGNSPNDKFVRLRKKVGNNFSLLSIRQLQGYTIDQWFKLVLVMDDNKFNAYISDENGLDGNLIKVFDNDVFNNEIKLGMVGLSTYKTRAFFYEISLDSNENFDKSKLDLEEEGGRLYVEREKLAIPVLSSNGNSGAMFSRLNGHINNFSWGQCLKYATPNEKTKLCDMIFKSKVEIDKCNVRKS